MLSEMHARFDGNVDIREPTTARGVDGAHFDNPGPREHGHYSVIDRDTAL
jgi:hypothetical protein